MNELVVDLSRRLSIKHRHVNPNYPQATGLVEKTNGILTNIIEKIVLEKRKEWDIYIVEALWSYRIAFKTSTRFTPFQLAFGIQAIIPIELELTSLRTAFKHNIGDVQEITACIHSLEKLDETRSQVSHNYETLPLARKTTWEEI